MRKSHWEQVTSDGNTTYHPHRRQKEFPQVYRPHRKQSRKRQEFPQTCHLHRRQKLCFCYSIRIN